MRGSTFFVILIIVIGLAMIATGLRGQAREALEVLKK